MNQVTAWQPVTLEKIISFYRLRVNIFLHIKSNIIKKIKLFFNSDKIYYNFNKAIANII